MSRYTYERRSQLYGTNRPFPVKKVFRSKEEIAKMREHSMRLSDFHIGLEFWMSGSHWRCTDVGSRVVVAIKLDHDDDPSWYNGPPYAVVESVLDEYVHHVCSLTRHGGNTYGYTDEEIEQSRIAGKSRIVRTSSPPPRTPEEQATFDAEMRKKFEAARAKWIEEKPMRDWQETVEREALTAHRAKRTPQPEPAESTKPPTIVRRIHDYGGWENYARLRLEEREKRTGKKLTEEDLP